MQTNTIITRRAVPDDYDVVGRLLLEISAQHRAGRPDLFRPASRKYDEVAYNALLADENENTVIFVAEEKIENDSGNHTSVVGYIICKLNKFSEHAVFNDYTSLYIDDLCIDSSARGMNAGTKLMHAAEEYARSIGCHNLTLNVWEFNEGAKAFYDKLGYTTQRRIMEFNLE